MPKLLRVSNKLNLNPIEALWLCTLF